MKKNYKFTYSISLVVLFLSILSCRFPYKIVPNLPTTPPPTDIFTPYPSNTPQPTKDATPTPENTAVLVESIPVSGSVLTWIDYSNFVFVPAGEFKIGKDSYDPENFSPSHKVSLPSFWIQQAEVTNQQYAQCVEEGKCSAPIQEQDVPYWYDNLYDSNHPVVGVSWFQAREYCSYIQSRLPTEAEWEVAARGLESKLFPWGGNKPNCDYSNFKGCLEPAMPYDVGSFTYGVSGFNAFDMAGNVFEWVNDWYADDYYASSPLTNPTGPADGTRKVYRGGSYKSTKDEISSILRFAIEPEKQASDLGFRCVLLGDPTTDLAMQIGQPCKVLAINDPAQTQSTSTPYPCSSAEVTGFCQLLGGKPSYGVDIYQTGCFGNSLNSMTANLQPLSCNITQLSNGGNKYLCTFPKMAQGIKVNVSYCHTIDSPIVSRACPTGYQMNQNSQVCELEYSKLPVPPCPKDFLDVPPYGCLPINNPDKGGCPIGYYSIESNVSSSCMPLNACMLSNAPEACVNTTCENDLILNTSKGCCDSPALPKNNCATNLLYNSDQNVCIESQLLPNDCSTVETKIPNCPTLTPTATPTREPQTTTCSDYKDPDSCLKNGCDWLEGFFRCN